MWDVLEVLTRLVVGGLLVTAGVAKLSSTPAWRLVWLLSYQLLPPRSWVIRSMAWAVPAAEITIGVIFLAGAFGSGGAVAAGVLLVIVTAAVVSGLVRGLEISCGCYGRLGDLISWRVVVRNLVLVAMAAAVAAHGVSTASAGSWPIGAQLALVAGGLALAAILVVRSRHAKANDPADPSEPITTLSHTEMSPP